MNKVLEISGLKRSFEQAGVIIEVLRGVDLSVAQGEIVGLLGPSGAGKSTLLQAVGLLEGGFEGSIRILGEEASRLDDPAALSSGATGSASSISSTICSPISARPRM